MIAQLLFAVLRHLLTGAGGALVAHGYLGQDEVSTAVGAVMSLAGIGWSVWQKYQVRPRPNPLPAIASQTETADDLNRAETLLLRQPGE